jgi:hypothetical protein
MMETEEGRLALQKYSTMVPLLQESSRESQPLRLLFFRLLK